MIDILILCGGLGKRLRPVVKDTSKVMASIQGRPFLDFLVRSIRDQGFKRLILCTGYKAESIEHYFQENHFGVAMEFSKEKEPLGTGGAVKNARPFIQSSPFIVMNGDSFCPLDLKSFMTFHASSCALASMAVTRVKEPQDFGGIRLDQAGRIVSYEEKKAGALRKDGFVNAGIYCFQRDVFALMPRRSRFSLEYDFFPELIGKPFYGFEVKQKFLDIGTPERYRRAQRFLMKVMKGT